MKITDLFSTGGPLLSFEVFPPKNDDRHDCVTAAALGIAALKPAFMSVTYGAGGSNSRNTTEIASRIQNEYGVPALAHMTCIGSGLEALERQINEMKSAGIENIMALRGDVPREGIKEPGVFAHTSELIPFIREKGDFCIGAACYPEGHPECESRRKDIENLKIKVDSGCDFLTTQMFFDNNIMYNFLYQIREAGITVPVLAGIMPITNVKQIIRTRDMTGTALPRKFTSLLDRFGSDPESMKRAGIIYATEQILELVANGVDRIHLYTMNKPEIARAIQANLKGLCFDDV